MTTTFDIDEIERLLAAATGSGVWTLRRVMDKTFRVRTEAGSFVATVTYEQDTALIIALHNSAPAMIAELRELRAENARLKRDKGTLLQFAQAIKTWRADANSYDRECGHTKRHYCEDVELMEKAAEYAMRRVGIRAALGEPQ